MKTKISQSLFFATIIFLISGIISAQESYWIRHAIDFTLSGADGVRLADVNGDRLMDITTGWEETGYTKVYLHPGNKRVQQEWPSVIVGRTVSVEDAVFADLDGDGGIDVISSTEGESKKIYINWAPARPDDYLDSAKWTSKVLPASDGLMRWMFAIPMQVDGANGLDIIAGAKDNNAMIGWFQAPENPRRISDWKWHPIFPATWVMSLIIKDMDNDGDMDIVTSDRKSGDTRGVRWMENPGPGPDQILEWDNHFIGAKGREVMFMDIYDLDEDGFEDAVVTEYTNQKIVFMRRLDSKGLKWDEYEIDLPDIAGRAKAVKVGDIDGDGTPDIVHSANTLGDENKAGIIWLSVKNRVTDSQWDWHAVSGPEGYKFDRIELLDIDGDGDLDILTCEENYGENSRGLGIIWYENPYKK